MNYEQEEVKLLDIQLITTLLYIGSLFLSIIITYNDKLIIQKKKTPFTKEQIKTISIFNRFLVLILTLVFLYINFKNKEIAKELRKNLEPFTLQNIASELSLLAALIVLYVVIKTEGGQYSIVVGSGNPNI